MEFTYAQLLEKVESGEVPILGGIVKGPFAEYDIQYLEPINVDTATSRRRKVRTTLKSMKYSPPGKNSVILDNLNMIMDVCIRIPVIRKEELTTKDVYLKKRVPLEKVTAGLENLKKKLALIRNVAYFRLQAAKNVEDIKDVFKIYSSSDIIGRQEIKKSALNMLVSVGQRFDETNLYDELWKLSKEVFSD